jgi:two-component system chemotaxis response regulator CheY
VRQSAPTAARVRQCLIVDDSRMIRKVSRQIVESLGYQVTEAEDGREALARCERAKPDLILLDWNMPVMTGIEFVAALRQQEGGWNPRVVFCTTENDPAYIKAGIEAGADEYVIKPFDPPTLLAKLQAIGVA